MSKQKDILLFDVDGTICESGKIIEEHIVNKIVELSEKYDIGIVGGGTYEKIMFQLNNKIFPNHIFSECGSVYNKKIGQTKNYDEIYKNNLREIPEYIKINSLVKLALNYISKVDYLVSGNFVDLRNGLIYISLVGMSATEEERINFIKEDSLKNHRFKLLEQLKQKAESLKIEDTIDIVYGGSVGIAIYPKKWNKTQVLNIIDNKKYNKIYFFGDKYEKDGNDYELISHPYVIGIPVNNVNHTYNILCSNLY